VARRLYDLSKDQLATNSREFAIRWLVSIAVAIFDQMAVAARATAELRPCGTERPSENAGEPAHHISICFDDLPSATACAVESHTPDFLVERP
jgi:hypothetical protein